MPAAQPQVVGATRPSPDAGGPARDVSADCRWCMRICEDVSAAECGRMTASSDLSALILRYD